MANKLIIAAAGSGKTTELIRQSLLINDHPVLITTYTEANANEIHAKFIKINGCIPPNITIQTWFSLLIEHGVKPYQSVLFDHKVNGMLLVNKKSGFRAISKAKFPIYWGEDNFDNHYFTNDKRIYSDKLSKLVCKINSESSGKVINRLVSVYPTIFIDECQDLAGYDLDIIKLLAVYTKNLMLVCDPRQVTYLTHNENKYTKYRNGLIEDFLNNECKKTKFTIDSETLSYSYRCNQLICNYSNKLFPAIKPCDSKQVKTTDHDGVFLVDIKDCLRYLEKYNPVQLRWSISNKDVNPNYEVHNFGQSKGLTFNRVLVYPTEKMLEWMQNHNADLLDETRAKLYVGLTRAKYSVGIVCNTDKTNFIGGVTKFT